MELHVGRCTWQRFCRWPSAPLPRGPGAATLKTVTRSRSMALLLCPSSRPLVWYRSQDYSCLHEAATQHLSERNLSERKLAPVRYNRLQPAGELAEWLKAAVC